MTLPRYSRLAPEDVAYLRAADHDAERDQWRRAQGAASAMLAIYSHTHPRPLYYETAPQRLEAALRELRGTRVHEHAARNAETAEAILRMIEERGNAGSLHEAVDAYLDEALEDWTAVIYGPDVLREIQEREQEEPPQYRRRAAGGR